jgi:thiamine kinase-like enzyme
MGDFWPGNIIVSNSDVGRAYVVDWEVCRPGLAGLEIGQFCAEIGFVQHFHPEHASTAEAVLGGFMRAYSATASPEEEVLRMADVHVGVHTVVIAPRVDWGARDATRAAVRRGVRRIVQGSECRQP